jgi:hypothetical protein
MIWQKFFIPIQAGHRTRSMQEIISTRGKFHLFTEKNERPPSLQLHGMFGWHETVKFLTMSTPLLDAWKISVGAHWLYGLITANNLPKRYSKLGGTTNRIV